MFDKMVVAILSAMLIGCVLGGSARAGEDMTPSPERAEQLKRDGNYREAAAMFEKLAFETATSPREAVSLLDSAWQCGREFDRNYAVGLREKALARWPDSWRIAALAALIHPNGQGTYFRPVDMPDAPLIGGLPLYLSDRDRARAISLMVSAEPNLDNPSDPATPGEKIDFYLQLGRLVLMNRGDASAWRLTALTDLESAADNDHSWGMPGPVRGAPVDGDGNPVVYTVPATWDAAENDGQRWRWTVARMAEQGKAGRDAADLVLGEFLRGQFGVHTMVSGHPLPRSTDIAGETGPFAVRTLEENETIARLATGLKRFVMPDDYNFITLLGRVAETGEPNRKLEALEQLAGEFEDRQQYDRALGLWRRAAAVKLPADKKEEAAALFRRRTAEAAIARITAKAGLLEPGPAAPAGKRTTFTYLFRNGDRVDFVARRLDEQALLRDTRSLITSGAKREFHSVPLMGELVNDENRLEKYIAETAAEWSIGLDVPEGHHSRRIPVELPLDRAGCYLIEAAMHDGNVSRAVVWISDLALAKKDLPGQRIYFVADAVNGEPVAGATVSLLGYQNTYDNNGKPLFTNVRNFAEKTDANGLIVLSSKEAHGREWLAVAETDDGRMAYLGNDTFWSPRGNDDLVNRRTAFALTDRPVYRPGQEVQFKVWLGQADYAAPKTVAERGELVVRIHNPMGDLVQEMRRETDVYGGVDGVFAPDENAALGQYVIQVMDGNNNNHLGGVGFRLEEYKKPEFEVALDTPAEALPLGDTVQLKVRANYYYGAPVTDATVSYKIVRTTFRQDWTPPWRWDWLYGKGAAYNRPVGFGSRRGGYFLPPWEYEQPEIVADGEGSLDPDGVLRIILDTAPAKELFGDRDHSYEVTVEVTDRSRRTIVGSGRVVASRHPFSVKVWTNQGYYRAGQEVRADVKALLPMGGGLAAAGRATLYRVTYDANGVAAEREVSAYDVATDARGDAAVRLTVETAGQYRLACRLVDAAGNAVDGEAAITVRGETGDADFRFGALEMVVEKREYRPGDTVRVAINSENKDGVVLFFPRVERPVADAIRVVRLSGGAAEMELDIGKADQPNFFCDALTIVDGKMYTKACEIFVPPADKTLTVELTPDKDSYLPGEKAEFTVKVTDADGQPTAGQVAVTVYDKSVEYIAGGSNVGDIKAHFWSGRRYYSFRQGSSIGRQSIRVAGKRDKDWEPIGILGGIDADLDDDGVYVNGKLPGPAAGRMAAMRSALERPPSMAPTMDSYDAVAMPAAAPMMKREMAVTTGGGQAMAEAVVRSEFADTALWIAALETDADGRASFSLTMPENLTAWKARAWVMGADTRVGDGEREVETKKNVIVRPQAPRFLTQKDQVVLSANLHNYLPRTKTARAELVLEGGILEAADGIELVRTVELKAGGEARADWVVDAKRPGNARVIMKLLTDEESDAAEIIVPVIVHGARRVENFGGVLRDGDGEQTIRFTVPDERLPEQSLLQLSFSPSLVSTMLEALPYLIEYPYGCTEQTLNRFLPVVMTSAYLGRMGVSLEDARAMLDNAPTDDASEEWKRTFGDARAKLRALPVFDSAELEKMVEVGIERLTGMQNSDGGWGWFSGSGERSYAHTTAVVVHGLITAREHGAAIPMGVVDSGVRWLAAYRDDQLVRLGLSADADEKDLPVGKGGEKLRAKKTPDNLDAFVHMILTAYGKPDAAMRDILYRDRLSLSLTGLSMLGLALEKEGKVEELGMVVRNLSQFVETNEANDTAWLSTPSRGWWWWYNDAIETQAWYLKLLSRVDPRSDATARVAKYLLQNRKNGAYWRSTRDTAYAIEALSAYAAASGEIDPDMTVMVYLDGKQVMERRLDQSNLFADHRFTLAGLAVEAGEHELRIVRSGSGPLYHGGFLSVFSLEDPIAASGADLKVKRRYYRLTPEKKQGDFASSSGGAVSGRVEHYRREELAGPFSIEAPVALAGGDLVEVTLTIEAANDYEYLVFEDMKAAGLEAVELRSGYTGNRLGAYVEYRDEKVVLFMQSLPRGVHEISYRFRAEVPGSFSALPVFGGGMYATELFCNSDEMKVRITEAGVYE